MGFFDLFKPKHYDMDTLEGINAIPVPAKNYNTGDPTKDCIYYVLQRKATEHKKNGKMDLAIACLKKSNALSDYEEHPLLTPKDYLRLIKFLQSNGQLEEANAEIERMRQKHPSFFGECTVNQAYVAIKSRLGNSKEDTVFIITSRLCPECSMYNRRIFSVFGRDKRFPLLPPFLQRSVCPTCGLHIGYSHYFPGINGDLKKDIVFSNRPFSDARTAEEKKMWNEKLEKKRFNQKAQNDFEWICTNLPELAPKSIGGYKRMINSNSAAYQKLVSAASEKGYKI